MNDDIVQWNINAKDITYNKIELVSVLDTPSVNIEKNTIATNDFYIVNPTNGKKITLKYNGNEDYNFVLPPAAPSNTSLLTYNQQMTAWQSIGDLLDPNRDTYIVNPANGNKITLKYGGNVDYNFVLPPTAPPTNDISLLLANQQQNTLWQAAAGLLDRPAIWANNLESQIIAPTQGTIISSVAAVNVSWNNPEQIKITISDKYLPVVNKFEISINYKSTDSASYTTVTKVYDILPQQKLQQNGVSTVQVIKDNSNNNTWSTNIVNNTVVFNVTQLAGLFSITLGFFNSDLTSTINKLTISNLVFINAGWPYPPNISISSNSETQSVININASSVVSTDGNPTTNVILGSVGAPSIIMYRLIYKSLYSTILNRYNAVPIPTIDNSLMLSIPTGITSTTDVRQIILPNLYPGATYQVQAQSLNSINDRYSDLMTPGLEFQTSPLSYNGKYIDTALVSVSSPYTNNIIYNIGGVNITPLPQRFTNKDNNMIISIGDAIGIHVLENRGSSANTRIMTFSVEEKSNSGSPIYTTLAYADVKGFSNNLVPPTTVLTNSSLLTGKPKVTLLTLSTPVDNGTSDNIKGYYLKLAINTLTINLSGVWDALVNKYTKQTLTFRQAFYKEDDSGKIDGVNDRLADFDYYITDVNPTLSPSISIATLGIVNNTISDNSLYTTISGVRVSRSSVTLQLSKLVASNMGTCFYINNWLKYTFLNQTNRSINVSIPTVGTDLSSSSNTFIDLQGSVTFDASTTNYSINPIITLYVNNINNAPYNIGNITQTTPVIIDNPSLLIVSNTDNVINVDGVLKRGIQMKYPSRLNITTEGDYVPFIASRVIYDHSDKLIDNGADNNILMLSGGLYCSPSYGDDNTSVKRRYKDYTGYVGNSGINYSTVDISTGVYRYVVFRWSYSKSFTNVSTLKLKISGLTSTSNGVLPLKNVITATENKYTTQNNKDIKVYYRFEDNKSTSQNPSYVNNTQSTMASISSIWINAHVNNDSSFANNLATTIGNLTLGGLISATTTTNSVTYTLATPAFTPSSYTDNATIGPYLYAIIGIPSDTDLAFSNIEASI